MQRTLRLAAGDLAWLLGRQYAATAAPTLVVNHYQLHRRQRQALAGTALDVDGLNQLITIEAALSGGLVLCGHDGALRDLASVHGSYRTIAETPTALEVLDTYLAPLQPGAVHFVLDAQVSTSGQLASRMRLLAARHAWPWDVLVVPNMPTSRSLETLKRLPIHPVGAAPGTARTLPSQ
jgi:hypothetical protein